jgi:hypothetical protein
MININIIVIIWICRIWAPPVLHTPQKMLTLTDTPQGSQDCGRMGEVLMNGTKGGGRLGRHPATLGGFNVFHAT